MSKLMRVEKLLLTPEGEKAFERGEDVDSDDFRVSRFCYINPDFISDIEPTMKWNNYIFVTIAGQESCIRGEVEEFKKRCDDFLMKNSSLWHGYN